MKCTKPELVVLGPASELAQGGLEGRDDNTNGDKEQPMIGLLLGLDD